MTKKQVKNSYICVLLVLLLLVIMWVSGWCILPAFADTEQYTSALEDLQIDKNFDISTYPNNETDYEKSYFAEKIKSFYSIHLIQIAESTDGELFVYTYQPSQETTGFIATEINMSLSQSVNGTKLYGLTFLNCEGVFCKYKVKDFAVSDNSVRYYNITSIFREWQKDIDEDSGNDNTISAVAFKVGKCFMVTTDNGKLVYNCENVETVQIENPRVGFIRYSRGFGWHKEACDSHYVAFSTDWQIDYLYEAELEYVTYDNVMAFDGLPDLRNIDPVSHHVYYTDKDRFDVTEIDWLFGKTTEYSRIKSAQDFLNENNENIRADIKEIIKDSEWVLRFAETNYTSQKYVIAGHDTIRTTYTWVTDVTILRLKFKSAGSVYNLGAVSNKMTGSGIPDNPPPLTFWQYVWRCVVKLFKGTADFIETVVAVAAIFVVVALLPILLFVLSIVSPAFKEVMKIILKYTGKGIKWFFIGLWWLISAPFRLIIALVSSKGQRGAG